MKNKFTFVANEAHLFKIARQVIDDLSGENTETVDLSKVKNLRDIYDIRYTEDFTTLKMEQYFLEMIRAIGCSPYLDEPDSDPAPLESSSTMQSDRSSDSAEPVDLPALDTPLDEVVLPTRFTKLIKRLQSVSDEHDTFEVGKTLGDILSLSNSVLVDLPGVGGGYQAALRALKARYNDEQGLEIADASIPNLDDLEPLRLFYTNIPKAQIKVLEKLERRGQPCGIVELLTLDVTTLTEKHRFGKKLVSDLSQLQKTIRVEIEKIQSGEVDVHSLESDYLVPAIASNLTIEETEEIIIEDLDNYFNTLDEIDVDIIQRRWGFVEEKTSLEEIGKDHDVTRERVRQIAKNLNKSLPRYLRLSNETIWSKVEPLLAKNIPQHMKDLFSCFQREKDFYEVLSSLCGQRDIEGIVRPTVNNKLLSDFFSENGGPILYETVKEYLAECETDKIPDLDAAIVYLEKKGSIRINSGYVIPQGLGKTDAVAYVLASHPNGLPWADVANYVNKNNISRSSIYTDRLDSAAYMDESNIYLSGVGTYKHTRFIDFESLNIDGIFKELASFHKNTDHNVFHLNQCYESSQVLKENDYYTIRYIVKHYGEDYGFFFQGQSQSDSVGVERNFKNITQKEVVLEAMKSNAKPMTTIEVAGHLKSKSKNHAHLYIHQLMESYQIVQVNRMLYTVADIAYKNLDMVANIRAVNELLIAENKPVDSSMIMDVLNKKFSASYSKYFYGSLARFNEKQNSWYRKHSVFSVMPIPFDGLMDAAEKYCQSDQNLESNIATLTKHVSVNESTAKKTILNWRREALTG